MDFHKMLVNRHSIRRYTPEPVDPEQMRLILEAALMAPTSKSLRPWEFVLVEDKAMLEHLGKCKPNYATAVSNAPVAVVVTGDMERSDCWAEDCTMAAAFMQLQAEALGLSSCWTEVRGRFDANDEPSEDYVREALGIPEKYGVLCIISIGHKDEVRRPVDPSKLLWEKVHLGKF